MTAHEPENITALLREVTAPPGTARWRTAPADGVRTVIEPGADTGPRPAVGPAFRPGRPLTRWLPVTAGALAVVVAIVAVALVLRTRDTPPRPADPTPSVSASPSASASASGSPAASAPASAAGAAGASGVAGSAGPGRPAGAWPTTASTGVPAGTQLRTHTGDLTVTTAGAVVEGLLVTGVVIVRAPRVALRAMRIVPASGGYYAIRQEAGADDLVVEDVEIVGGGRTQLGVSQEAAGLTVRRALIRDVEQAVAVDNRATIVDSLIDRAQVGVISQGGAIGLTVRHNAITSVDGDAAIALYTNNGGQVDVTVDRNLLAGGNYTVFGGRAGGSRNIRFTDNRFSRAASPKGGRYGPVTLYDPAGPGNRWTGNAWADTGEPVQP